MERRKTAQPEPNSETEQPPENSQSLSGAGTNTVPVTEALPPSANQGVTKLIIVLIITGRGPDPCNLKVNRVHFLHLKKVF